MGRVVDLAELDPRFRIPFEAAWMQAKAEGLPLQVWETLRTPEDQDAAKARGASQLGGENAPHPRRAAADVVLTAAFAETQGHFQWHNGQRFPNLWAKGVNKQRTQVIDEDVLDVWYRWGELVEAQGLAWGGRFGDGGKLIGWDPYHAEHPDWREWPFPNPLPEGGGGAGLIALGLLALDFA